METTSLMAYAEIQPELGQRQLQVYKTIKKFEFCSNTMISRYLKLPINCITGRTRELRKKGLVVKSHITTCLITRHRSTFWRIK